MLFSMSKSDSCGSVVETIQEIPMKLTSIGLTVVGLMMLSGTCVMAADFHHNRPDKRHRGRNANGSNNSNKPWLTAGHS